MRASLHGKEKVEEEEKKMSDDYEYESAPPPAAESDSPPPAPAAAAAAAQAPRACRSVADYDTEDALRAALLSLDLNLTCPSSSRDGVPSVEDDDEDARQDQECVHKLNDNWDWVLTNFDAQHSVPQTVGDELRRLRVLKSYLILDSEREAAFDRLTAMASRTFGVPIALVSLVDLGRQWFMSNHGLGETTRETPRKLAFCAHAIVQKNDQDVLEIPDTHQDVRFRNHGLVTGPPYIRFYAGAPLICEGYKLGTFCIIDTKPWPQGLSDDQRANLLDFAALTCKAMEDRRQLLDKEDPSRLVAAAAHDLMTPLLGIQSSLATLLQQATTTMTTTTTTLDAQQTECVQIASKGTDLMRRICQSTLEALYEKHRSSSLIGAGSSGSACSHQIPWMIQQQQQQNHNHNNNESPPQQQQQQTVHLQEFVQVLNLLMQSVPKQVPLTLSLDVNVPKVIVCDDVKLFRCSLNFLSNACRNTQTGFIQFTIAPTNTTTTESNNNNNTTTPTTNTMLRFECVDTGRNLDYDVDQSPFGGGTTNSNNNNNYCSLKKDPNCSSGLGSGASDLGYYSVASQIDSLGGNCGYRKRGEGEDGSTLLDEQGRRMPGSIFWFTIPMILPQKAPPRNNINNNNQLGSLANVTCHTTSNSHVASNHDNNNNNDQAMHMNKDSPTSVVLDHTGAVVGAQNQKVAASKSSSTQMDQKMAGIQETNSNSAEEKPKKKALIIEDSVIVSKTLARGLSKLGYDVSEARNGKEGLEALQKELFHFTLCDFVMPVLDGVECARQYREWEKQQQQQDPSWRQFIIGISAHAGGNDVQKGLDAGMNIFQPKPVTTKVLKELEEHPKLKQFIEDLQKANENDNNSNSSGSPEIDMTNSEEASEYANAADTVAQKKGTKRSGESMAQGDHGLQNVDASNDMNDNDESKDDKGDELQTPKPKRPKLSETAVSSRSTGRNKKPVGKYCLIAMTESSAESVTILTKHMEGMDWEPTIVHDGKSALRYLKDKRWAAVFLHVDLPDMSACQCATEFRKWEKEKGQENRQMNVFLVGTNSDAESSEDRITLVQPPAGFDGILSNSLLRTDLSSVIQKTSMSTLLQGKNTSITTH